MIWGGWGAPNILHNFVDGVHVQRCTVARQAGLWHGYPDDNYNPNEDGQHLFAAATTPVKSTRGKKDTNKKKA